MESGYLRSLGLDVCRVTTPLNLVDCWGRAREVSAVASGSCGGGGTPSSWRPPQLSFEALPGALGSGVAASEEGGSSCSRPPRCFRIATWNVLAPAYALRKSFPDVSPEWLGWALRQPRVEAVVAELDADVFCFQEVENPVELRPWLAARGLDVFFAPRAERADGCAVAWRTCLFRCASQLVISFDDELASVAPPETVQIRYARRNVALVVELVGLEAAQKVRVLVATTHLYWGPQHEDVRAWQLQVLLERVAERYGRDVSLAFCGDFNALPGGAAHSLLADGRADFPRNLRRVERFLFDRDISKTARPLRLLGFDAAVETETERSKRERGAGSAKANGFGPPPVYARAICEGRVLVSASRSLLSKRDCPASYFIDNRQTELSLAGLCAELSLDIRPERFFTRCVKCNGTVVFLGNAGSSAYATSRSEEFHAPCGATLYECGACSQVYWFSPNIDSASARAQQQVQSLVRLIELRGAACATGAGEVVLPAHPERVSESFLRDGGGRLEHVFRLRSVYGDVENDSDKAIVTNSKYGFHGCIDYIWLTAELYVRGAQRLRAPREHELRAAAAERGAAGQSLPSLVGSAWPSDHWPLSVDIELPAADP